MKEQQTTTLSKEKGFTLSQHSKEQLKNRFGIDENFVKEYSDLFVKASQGVSKVVDNKMRNYPHQKVFINKRLNIVLMFDPYTNKVTTALYLDGQDGYQYMKKSFVG